MKKINTAPLAGMQELLPAEQAVFDELKKGIFETFVRHGFCHIETPVIERTEILLAKAGGETEKQIYFVQKTGEDKDMDGYPKESLRFDHTVPLARYVVQHANDLAFPFKVTQVARNFRGERPQRGRFREFYQCDVDIIGRESLALAADAEVIATLVQALAVFKLEKLVVRVSNRKILAGLLNALELDGVAGEILGVIDRAEKVTEAETVQTLTEYGVKGEKLAILQKFMKIKGCAEEVEMELEKVAMETKMLTMRQGATESEERTVAGMQKAIELQATGSDLFSEGIKELLTVLRLLEEQELPVRVQADMLIVRGLDYYTGTVFETFAEDYRQIGSLCSGGRYENLTANFGDQKFPGVGGSIGLSRLFYVLNELNLVPQAAQQQELVMVVPVSEQEQLMAMKAAEAIRKTGRAASVVLLDKKLGQKLTYAAKVGTHAVVIGETEAVARQAEVKDLTTGEKTQLIF